MIGDWVYGIVGTAVVAVSTLWYAGWRPWLTPAQKAKRDEERRQ